MPGCTVHHIGLLTYLRSDMSQATKSQHYKALKEAGVQFSKSYAKYTEAELEEAYNQLQEGLAAQQAAAAAVPQAGEMPELDEPFDPEAAAYFGFADPVEQEGVQPETQAAPAGSRSAPEQPVQQPPVRQADPNELPGQRLNDDFLQPIRTDEHGRIWFQEEVAKPAYPKPRGRRVLKYVDRGVRTETVQAGQFSETFEVAGSEPERASEIKITLPSFQVGIYKDPRFPFKIHTYGGNAAFDLFDVQNFYGGSELVPQEIKRVYVQNVLCYDIRTTIRAIQTEFRHMQMTGQLQPAPRQEQHA